MDVQFFLQLVKQIKRITAFTIHLVDEDNHWCVSHSAHLHQFTGLSLHTFCRVNDDDRRVDSGERAVSVFGEVLVTRRVQYVNLVGFALLSFGQIVKLHDRGRHRDTTLFLNVHPVGGGGLAYLVVLNGTGYLYLTTEEQKLFGERSLTGIRVRDDGEGAPTLYFVHIMITS